MTKFYQGVAGARGCNPRGIIIHNDAGSQGANAGFYRSWLPNQQAENGFAHYYVASDGTYQAENESNVAWHCANSYYNKNFIGIEVCQSTGDKNVFLSNEQKAFKLAAEICKRYGIIPNYDTIKLHKEVYATACPHRSWELHGQSVNAVKDYFITAINKYRNGQPTPQQATSRFNREFAENGTMYATERNWVKDTPTQSAPLVEWQEVGQGIKYKKVVWSDGIVWLEFTGWDGHTRYVAYADAQGTGFGRKYGYCV